MQHFVPHKAFKCVLTEWLCVSQVEKNKRVRKTYSFELIWGSLETESISGPSVYLNHMTKLSAQNDFIKLHSVYFPAHKIRHASDRPLCVLFFHAKNRTSQLQ